MLRRACAAEGVARAGIGADTATCASVPAIESPVCPPTVEAVAMRGPPTRAVNRRLRTRRLDIMLLESGGIASSRVRKPFSLTAERLARQARTRYQFATSCGRGATNRTEEGAGRAGRERGRGLQSP